MYGYYYSVGSHKAPLHLRSLATLGHTLKLLAQATFLDFANRSLLRIFKITLVTQLNQVSRLAHFTLEATEGTFNGFTVPNRHLDFDGQ